MTVVDPSNTFESESFVHQNPKFFSTKIPIHHWQLRNYITNPDGDLLYFASERDIYSLNVETGTRTHIAGLPWEARCTAAGYGWICSGGGNRGTFAVIRLDPAAELDYFGNRASPSPPTVRLEQLGREIVNSISIHKLEGNSEFGITDDIVAVLTNNDRTVRIYSLTSDSQTTVLDLPFPVNHATISPDGQMLVAVGDYQQCYFYERADLKPSPNSTSHKYASAHCIWELLDVIMLHVPKLQPATGYFSTAWSPNGRLCAVASEMGYISVIDIEALKALEEGEEAIVAVVASTRPEPIPHAHGVLPGAVRAMLFSPGPWDLLIWAEDQDRVCVADLRTGLRGRQVLHLDHNLSPQCVDVKDSPTNRYSRMRSDNFESEYNRLLRSRGIDNDNALETEEEFMALESRRIAREAIRDAELERLSARELEHSLREREQSLTQGRHRLDSLSRGPAARSIYYSDLSSGRSRRSTAAQSSAFSQDFPDLARQSETNANSNLPTNVRLVRDLMRDRMAGTESSSYTAGHYVPRRQASMLISSEDSYSSRGLPDWASIVAITADGEAGSLFHDDPSQSGRPSPPPPPAPDQLTDARRRRAQLQDQARRRAFNAREAERYHMMGLHRTDTYDPNYGLRTAGLAISADGRRLWAACDQGVFEYKINVKGRMMMPALEMR